MTLKTPPMRVSNSPNLFCSGDGLPVAFNSSPTNTASFCPTISGVISTVSQPNTSGKPSNIAINLRGLTSRMQFFVPNIFRCLYMSSPLTGFPTHALPVFARVRHCLDQSRRLKCFSFNEFSLAPIPTGCQKTEHMYRRII